MKITAIILLAVCLSAGAVGHTQTITLKVKNMPLVKVFDEITKQTGYSFVFTENMLNKAKRVSMQVANVSLTEALDKCFAEQPFTYTIFDKIIVLKEREVQKKDEIIEEEDLGIDVRGRVVNEDGEPVEGASVIVKGTGIGTKTNGDGFFELRGVDAGATLMITGVNIETREVKLDGRVELKITARTKVNAEEDVVIKAGYYDVKKRLATGNISRIDAKTIERQPVTNPLHAIQGRVPGVNIQQATGLPGGRISIEIRGRNSINRGIGSDPLYIVDGVPFSSETLGAGLGGIMQNHISPLSSINPSDIESIEVLKDADATAIYGSRGANGVVLITTKKGKVGKTSIDINVYHGIGKVGHFLNLLSRSEYLEMKIESLKNSNRWPLSPADYQSVPDVFLWDTTRYTDWQQNLIGGTAKVSSARIALTGGTAKTQYLFSGTYFRQGSVFQGDFNYQKASGLFNFNHTSDNDKFRMSLSTNYAVDNNKLPQEDLTYYAVRLAPTAPTLFDVNGNINWENNTWFNPMATYLKPKYRASGNNFITNASFHYELLPGLKLKSNLGYNKRDLEQFSTVPFSSARPDQLASFQAYSLFGIGMVKTWILEPQLEYTRSLGKGTIIILGGTSFQETMKKSEVKRASGFTSDAMLENIGAAPSVSIKDFNAYMYRYIAIFGRVNYNLENKYILNLTARRDGSSRFGAGRQFGNFGAVGGAWVFSKERFLKGRFGFLSFGKLRMSYGITGSDNIGDYQYLDSYNSTQNPYQGMTGLVPTRIANEDYGWENNKKLELSLELQFLDRLDFEASYYRNRSSNQLIGYSLPSITGQISVLRNLPAIVENRGWEFAITSENLKGKFIWLTDLNLTIPRNELIEYPDLENSPYNFVIGKPLSVIQGFIYTGVDPLTGNYTFDDFNKDGILNVDDFQILGSRSVKFFLGLNNSIGFKKWLFDFHFQAVKQTGASYIGDFSFPTFVGYYSNYPRLVMDRWSYPGHVTDIQKFGSYGSEGYSNLKLSDRYLTDASYIKLRNIQLSYELPEGWTNKFKMIRANVYLQGQNLFTITKYVGLDPETQTSKRLPPLRALTFGIQISF